MKAEEASAIMSLAGSIAKLQIQTGEMLEVLKDILHAVERGGLDFDDEDEDGGAQQVLPGTAPAPSAPDINKQMEAAMMGMLAENPGLAAAFAAIAAKNGTNNGAGG